MKKYLINFILFGAIIMFFGWGAWNVLEYKEIKKIENQKNAYEARLILPKQNCKGVSLNDAEYAKVRAESGDAKDLYIYASFLSQNIRKNHDTKDISDEALSMLHQSAELGYPEAQGFLCKYYYGRAIYSAENNSSQMFDWCLKSAKHNHRSSQSTLGRVYYDGVGVPENKEESYYWYKLSGSMSGMGKKVAAELNDEEIQRVNDRVDQWIPEKPIAKNGSLSPISELILAASYKPEMPLNIAGLLCDGEARNCKILDRCGDLVGIVCPRNKPKYVIARLSTKEIVSECPKGKAGCFDFVPEEWTCPSPQNMPLSTQDQEKYPKYKNAVSCGEVLGVDYGSANDGPYYFFDKETEKKLGSCSFWQSSRTQSPCQPPKEWFCGFPSNYN